MIYIDQPIGTGFSYGTVTVGSTQAAAPFIWKAFQILFESKLFSKYQARESVLIRSWLLNIAEFMMVQVYFCDGELWGALWTKLCYLFRRTEYKHLKGGAGRRIDQCQCNDDQQVSWILLRQTRTNVF